MTNIHKGKQQQAISVSRSAKPVRLEVDSKPQSARDVLSVQFVVSAVAERLLASVFATA